MEGTQIPASALQHNRSHCRVRVLLWQIEAVHSTSLREPSGIWKGNCARLSFKRYRPLANVCMQKSWDSPSSTSLLSLF